MKPFHNGPSLPRLFLALTLGLLLASCSREPDSVVGGSAWLSADRSGGVYDVIVYPLNEDELAYFDSTLENLEAAAKEYPREWDTISESEDPSIAAAPNALWRAAGVSGRDVIAASLKLTFLREFSEDRTGLEADMKENLSWLEGRLDASATRDEELWESANTIRALLEVIAANRESGTFEWYDSNRIRIDATLDRFLSIGEPEGQ